MASTLAEISCSWCNVKSYKKKAELDYQQRKYESLGGRGKRQTYCSRKCGQEASGFLHAVNLTDIKSVAKSLRRREAPRYVKVKRFLKFIGARFKTEYNLPNTKFIFDLAIKFDNRKILVEFDSHIHNTDSALIRDAKRDRKANKLGWEVFRIAHERGLHVFPARLVKSILF